MNIKYIIIHHSAVSRTKNSEQFDAINRYHKSKGWGMIGYHYLIEPDGEIKDGRKETQNGAHCIGHNHESIGICLTGDFDIEMPTENQKKSLKESLSVLLERYGEAEIKYHRDFANYKSCPGKLISDDWAKNLINNTKKMILTIDEDNDQYLVDRTSKFAVSIVDEKMLKEITSHFCKSGIELEKPKLTEMSGYLIIRGATKLRWKEFLNI